MPIPTEIRVVEPWVALDETKDAKAIERFASELKQELSPGHVLFGVAAVARAARIDRDDVLFELTGAKSLLAVVHLTFKHSAEADPRQPKTRFLNSWMAFADEVDRTAEKNGR